MSGHPSDRGLCGTCEHAQVITSARGSTFSLCKLSFVDSKFAKYPVLPVRQCAGYKGEAVTCRGRFVPVAGSHRGNKSLQYLSSKSRIMLKFAQLGKTGIYAPIQATVGTKVGTVTIRARRLETSR